MTQIRLNTEQAREVGRTLVAEGERLAEIGYELEHAIASLETWAWDGTSRWRAEPLLGRVRPESARVAQELEELGRKLVHVAEVFEQEDNTAAHNLAGMPWVDFASGSDRVEGGDPENWPQSMRDLAIALEALPADKPIQIIQIGPDDYVVLLKGTQEEGGHNMGSALPAGLALPSAYELEVRELIYKELPVPPNRNIHFVGHSQGGIVANNIADNQDFLAKYDVQTVTTFGSPVNVRENPNVDYYRYGVIGDPVPALSLGIPGETRPVLGSVVDQTWVDGFQSGEFSHSAYDHSVLLAMTPLPKGLEITQWDVKGVYPVSRKDSLSLVWANRQDLISINPIRRNMAWIDFSFEASKTLTLAGVEYGVETVSSRFPPVVRDAIDGYTDRAYDLVISSPTPSQAMTQTSVDLAIGAEKLVGSAVDLGGRALDTTVDLVDEAPSSIGGFIGNLFG